MTDLLIPIAGGLISASIGGGVYCARWFNSSAYSAPAKRWSKSFHYYRGMLAQMVNEEFEGTLAEAVELQTKIVTFGAKPVRGHERPGPGMTPVPLTQVMKVDKYDNTVVWIDPFMRITGDYYSKHINYDLHRYTDPLETLAEALSTAHVKTGGKQEGLEPVQKFVREHAAHLLINYRTSPLEQKKFSLEETTKSMIRQRRLVGLLAEAKRAAVNAQTIHVLNRTKGYNAVEEASAIAIEVITSHKNDKIKSDKAVSVSGEVASQEVTLSATSKGALSPQEVWMVSLYESKKQGLSADTRRTCQNLIQKMYSAVDLAVKARSFSTAAKEKTLELSNQNRKFALAELEELLESNDGLTVEEAEAIHSLRVDNKYLTAHKQERGAMKETKNA